MFAKRKARKIQVAEENDKPTTAPESAPEEPMNDGKPSLQPQSPASLSLIPLQHTRHLADANTLTTAPPAVSPSTVKFTRRPIKSSSLRKSININDDAPISPGTPAAAADDDDDDARSAVIRPAMSRSGSTRTKSRKSSSRLSFGVTEDSADSAPYTTPKKNPTAANLTQRATENSALRASSTTRQIPSRSFGAEPDRPAYSREFLEELQSSTPNTPANLDTLSLHDDPDGMSLSAAELDGAILVPSADATLSTSTLTTSHIPSALEIRAKKERRARLRQEGDAYASDASDNDDGYIALSSKKKDDTRLLAEDEDLGEGYDDFVEDGRLELGRRGEGAARRRQRREMAALIDVAEGASEDGGDSDSDAERKAVYEAAQTRAAMEGLRAVGAAGGEEEDVGGMGRIVIPKMKPLPELEGSLARMRELVRGMEEGVRGKKGRIEAVERERQEILDREREVQAVLNEAGLKYQAVMGIKSEHPLNPEALAAQSPLRNAAAGLGAGERGLESFGTPTRVADEDGDVAMEE